MLAAPAPSSSSSSGGDYYNEQEPRAAGLSTILKCDGDDAKEIARKSTIRCTVLIIVSLALLLRNHIYSLTLLKSKGFFAK